jgi:hypothetical protein
MRTRGTRQEGKSDADDRAKGDDASPRRRPATEVACNRQ